MKRVRFHLAYSKDNSFSSIFAQVRYGGGKLFKTKTRLSIEKRFWDPEHQRVKATRLFPFYIEYNIRLNKIEEIIQGVYYKAVAANSMPSKDDFVQALKGDHENEGMTLSKFIDVFIKERKESTHYAAGSGAVYRVVVKKYRAFCAKTKRQYDFKDIDMAFFFAFTKYLGEGNYSSNYLNKIVVTLKTILNDAKERGYNKYDHYKSKKFTIKRVRTTRVYLNEAELKLLFEHKFKHNYLRNATDSFLIGAWSALRVSDFKKVIKENLETYKGMELIKLQTKKGKKPIAVPLHEGIKKVIELRGFPKSISNQKLNDYIKVACMEVGIDQKVVIYSSRNSEQISELMPKYEMITSHTARRSFATNMFIRGYSLSVIGEMMGHSSERMTRGYICTGPDEVAHKVGGDDFFKL